MLTLVSVVSASPTGNPTSSSPSTAPTSFAQLPINQDDLNAFSQLSTNLNRATWRDCNANGDPCFVCSNNDTESAAVDCEAHPMLGALNRKERRITGFRFRNLNIKGTVDQFVLFAFTALKHVDLSSNRSRAWGNRILPSFGSNCVEVKACDADGGSCNFGVVAPLCSALPPTPAPTSAPSQVGLYVGIAVGGAIALGLLSLTLIYLTNRRNKKRAREEKRKAKDRKRRKMMQGNDEEDVVSVFSQGTIGGSSMGSAPPARKSISKKPYSSLRTRRNSYQKMYRAPSGDSQGSMVSAGGAAPPPPRWVQQVDPNTGIPYWVDPASGAITRENPMMGLAPPPSGNKSMMRKDSAKALAKKGSSRALKSASSAHQVLTKKGSSRNVAAPSGPPVPPQSRMPSSMSMQRMPVPGEAPVGPWEEVFDNATGSTYWVNSSTGQFSWTRPM